MFFISFINTRSFKKNNNSYIYSFINCSSSSSFVWHRGKGSKRWLSLYFFRFQPIEFVKPFFILVTAKILSLEDLKHKNSSYLFSFLLLLSIIILLVNQPDLGQSILIIGTWISIVFISGISVIYIISFFGISAASLAGLLIFLPEKFGYITKRLTSFVDPSKGDNFQAQKALDAIKQGGLKGQGMGEGVLKDNVPEAHTDYIIAVITEEFGSIVSILIIHGFYISLLELLKSQSQRWIKTLKFHYAACLHF